MKQHNSFRIQGMSLAEKILGIILTFVDVLSIFLLPLGVSNDSAFLTFLPVIMMLMVIAFWAIVLLRHRNRN